MAFTLENKRVTAYVENVFTFKKHPEIGRGYSPFTPEEILSLQEHCKKHHIRLVGSLSSFGHLKYSIAAAIQTLRRETRIPRFSGREQLFAQLTPFN